MVILCTIDLETREVSLPAGQVIASYDHNVDVIRFQAETIPGFSLNTSSIKIAAQGPNKARHDYAVDPSTVSIEEETGYITFDWPIPAGVTEMPLDVFKYGDKGNLIFAVCAEIIDGSTVSKAWHSDDGIITVVAHLEPEAGGGEDPEEEATNAQKIAQLQTDVAIIRTEIGDIVTPQMYGAKGDGVTDDSNALLTCFTEAITKRKSVYIPSGTYICDNNVLVFSLTNGQFLNVFGEGPSSCIKRKDQTADADWRILLNISASASAIADISSVEFHHLKLDGNARNQPLPETNFGFEHSATLRIIGNSASRIKKVVIDDVVIDDSVADGLYFPGSGSAYIDDVFINNFVTYTRTRVRSDICFTGYPESIFVTNCKVPKFEFEYNQSPDVPTNVYISNLECETMDVIGTMRMEAVNLTVKTHCYLGRVLGNIADSYITISDRRIRIGDITFTNCEFHLTEIPAETEGDPPSVQALTIEYAGTKACFQKCRFVINGDAETYTGYLIKADIGTILCVDNCEFDNRATGIMADRCEKITVKNCVVSTPSLMNLMSSAAYPVNAVFDNLLILNTGRLGKLQPNSGSVLFNNVTCIGIDSAYIQRENSAWITDAVIRGSRKIYIDAPFTKELVSGKTGGVFLGDRYINTNALENEPMEWVRTQTFYATTKSTGYYRLHLRAVPNNPVGATADRPTSVLGQGFQYYDTDLAKPILWNGTAWVNLDGTALQGG